MAGSIEDQLEVHHSKIVPDVIAPGLPVLFVGVNPGIRSGETHHHFAHPSSRLWTALYESGFTPQLLRPAVSACFSTTASV